MPLHKHTWVLSIDDGFCQVLLSFSLVKSFTSCSPAICCIWNSAEQFTVAGSNTNCSYIAQLYILISTHTIYNYTFAVYEQLVLLSGFVWNMWWQMNLKGLIVTFTVNLGSETRSVMAAGLCFSSAGPLLQHTTRSMWGLTSSGYKMPWKYQTKDRSKKDLPAEP